MRTLTSSLVYKPISYNGELDTRCLVRGPNVGVNDSADSLESATNAGVDDSLARGWLPRGPNARANDSVGNPVDNGLQALQASLTKTNTSTDLEPV